MAAPKNGLPDRESTGPATHGDSLPVSLERRLASAFSGRPDASPAAADPGSSTTPSASPPRDPACETLASFELLKLAYRELKDATLASATIAIAFAGALGTTMPSTSVWIWLGVMLAAAGYRLRLNAAFHRFEVQPSDYPRWARHHVAATLSSGLGWGASVWLFPTLEQTNVLGLVHVLILASVTAGASRLLIPVGNGGRGYLLVVMLPLAARFFAAADVTGLTGGACVLAFTFYLFGAARRHQSALSEAITLRLERESLAATVQAQQVQREARETELRDARERAELASRAKGDFLAAVSHEIRTPMNGVLGMLRIVRETPLSPEQRAYLKTASDSAETLLLLLNDVLDFARIDSGQLELQSTPFPPAATVRAVAELMHARARDKGLQFNLHVDEQLPGAIIGDATRLRQILVALIGNAIKFTERGHVDFTVTCAERSENRVVLHFTVADTGIGIDSSALDRLFKPFSQVDGTLGRRYGGTGLGLAISTRLARAMGGLLQVQSTLNRGTTFRLILPCLLPDPVAGALPTAAETARPAPEARFGRVLVVEDDSVNRQVIDLFLKKIHLAVKFAPDGETAVQLATSETFDAILMDYQLPGIDGLETTRRIRQRLAGGRPVRIIALTANAGASVREACLEAGMDDFLPKPVRFEQLVETLERNLPRQR
jgi:signal transduction histidine kinase/ActR/RegA family two-component response regulator